MKKTSNSTEPVYELKHRLAGAIILVVLAVVVIPLLLSEPGADASSKTTQTEAIDDEGNVFVSRIVPLNIDNVNKQPENDNQNNAETDSGVTIIDDSKPALLDLTNTQSQPSSTTDISSSDDSSSKAISAVVMTQEAKVAPKTTSQAEAKTESQQRKSEVIVAASSQQSEQTVESGWVVRVGTFSKDANVESVSKTLSNSGFTPKTTLVSTSLGNSTRVWLGPYAKRTTADKVSKRLQNLVGEKGYVTRSAS